MRFKNYVLKKVQSKTGGKKWESHKGSPIKLAVFFALHRKQSIKKFLKEIIYGYSACGKPQLFIFNLRHRL